MNRLVIILGLVVLSMTATAQTAYPYLELPDSINHIEFEWVDLDNDGLLDILLMMKSTTNVDYIGIIKGDTTNTSLELLRTFPIISYQAYLLADFDRDNDIDVLVSGKKNSTDVTVIYLNTGTFDFEEKLAPLGAFSIARFADLDNDAVPELLISGSVAGGAYMRILKEFPGDSWQTMHDSLDIACSSIESFDADGDGDNDVFISGKSSMGEPMSKFLINDGNFYFKTKSATSLSGFSSSGDFDGDGLFEIILIAEDKNGAWHTTKFQNNAGTYASSELPLSLRNGKPFVADFNYDGVADISYYGMDPSGDTINIIQFSTGAIHSLPSSHLRGQRFGDLEGDGNLELLTLTDNGPLRLTVSRNMPRGTNLSPGSPVHAIALPIFDRVFMHWEKPADDHTPTKSLTYDMFLSGVSNYKAGEFDLMRERRLTVTHGNNGTNNFALLKDIDPNGLKFFIQAVDNSFHAGTRLGLSTVCLGGVGIGPGACATISTEEVSVCTGENITFNAPAGALWFSFANGFLGMGGEHSFSTASSAKGDTIFYFHPLEEGCSSLKAWTIRVNNDTLKIEKDEKYGCANSSIEFIVETGWESISWSSQNLGDLGSGNSITYNITQPDSVFVTLSNAQACQILRKTAIKLSKPNVKVSAEQIKVMSGGEVQLQASGAQRYVWSPSTGLSESDIPNPVASPSTTVQYIVTGYDSLECSAQASVTVMVENTGFIPNLFSPNDDGQNDQLKIYGVSSAQRFSLSIYDREGSLVYKTSDVSEAVQTGWDGTKNGSKQPPGVYFWEVKGEVSDGQLLLNGKDSGSIVLIR
jgi:gliding motility-associated-like protein